jgi:hypothetical protein
MHAPQQALYLRARPAAPRIILRRLPVRGRTARGPRCGISNAATAVRMMRPMEDQPEPPLTPGPFAHLARREPRSEQQQRIDAFNEHQRRRGSRKRWHDYFPDEAANDCER